MAKKDYKNAFAKLAPGTEQFESETAEEQTIESEKCVYFNPVQAIVQRNYDIGIEIGSSCSVA